MGPAQKVLAEVGEQEAVSGNPACRFEHGEGAMNETGRGGGLGYGGEGGAQRFGLGAEAAEPELAALIGCSRWQGGGECFGVKQAGEEKQGDDGDAGPQVGQGELRQQRDGTAASLAEVAAYTDRAVERGVDEGAGVEAVRDEPAFGPALRALGGAMEIRIGQLLDVGLHRTQEWV